MKLKIIIITFSILLFNLIYANETENERLNSWIKGRKEILAELDSLIAKGIPIDFDKMELESREHTMAGGIRQIEFYLRFMTDGVRFTQKMGIDGIVKWWYKPEGGLDPRSIEWYKMAGQYTVTDEDSSYFNKYKPIITKKLYEFLDDEYPALQVSSARALAFMGVENSIVIQKLKYYANGTNSYKWNLENTSYYSKTTVDFYQRRGKTAADRKRDAIRELKRGANQGLEYIYKRENNNNKKNDLLNFNKIKQKTRDLDYFSYRILEGLISNVEIEMLLTSVSAVGLLSVGIVPIPPHTQNINSHIKK